MSNLGKTKEILISPITSMRMSVNPSNCKWVLYDGHMQVGTKTLFGHKIYHIRGSGFQYHYSKYFSAFRAASWLRQNAIKSERHSTSGWSHDDAELVITHRRLFSEIQDFHKILAATLRALESPVHIPQKIFIR